MPEQDAKAKRQTERDVDWLRGLLTTAGLRGFSGRLVVSYDRGHVTQVQEERTLRPPPAPSEAKNNSIL